LHELAKKLHKSVAQVVLRWATQHNVIVIPKSVTKSRIEENIKIFDFTLSTEEMNLVDALNMNARTVTHEWGRTHKFYPFESDY